MPAAAPICLTPAIHHDKHGVQCRGRTAAVCERFKSDSKGPNSGGLKAIQKGRTAAGVGTRSTASLPHRLWCEKDRFHVVFGAKRIAFAVHLGREGALCSIGSASARI
jgi:hypothetical protein